MVRVRKIKKLIPVSQEEVDKKWGEGRTKAERVKHIVLDDGEIIKFYYIHPSEADKIREGENWIHDQEVIRWNLSDRNEIIKKFVIEAIKINREMGCDPFDWKLSYYAEEKLKKINPFAFQVIQECFVRILKVCNQYGLLAYCPKHEVGIIADLCELVGVPQKQDWEGHLTEKEIEIWREFLKRMNYKQEG